ncbi:alkaline phosphatase family protein [Polymorphospora rubra]|uniref:Phosphodiesterase n=1 Tax=Polymorphospora rubra TaxID=338584 RepID=A0A810MX37_9ACTN|nr:alkaline phosphatase family protein [Polymorphospora rubra]BCJ65781.1 phosphodiesterase [Polymorphospora rubra]
MPRAMIIGLDCLVPDVLEAPMDTLMPTVAGLARRGIGGVLRSTLPPITVPAWTSMLTGRDPGELGVYGFRNRRSFGYDDLVMANSTSVRLPRLWDRLTSAGRPSIVVGVPQTSPPPAIDGVLVSGFEGPIAGGAYTHPAGLATEIDRVVGEYLFDIPDFRSAGLPDVLRTARLMTERRFTLMRHLVTTRDWDFAMLHEIAPDRMHHCFWRYHDERHPGHPPDSPYRDAIRDYYRFLDERVAELIDAAGPETAVLVASDHGATAMHGGVCVNEILREAGLLTLRAEPDGPTPLTADMVDWSRTRVWGEGGYYARIFLNVAGREPAGIVPREQVPDLIEQIRDLFGVTDLGPAGILRNAVHTPAELYRRVRGIPPDLLAFFGEEKWRAIGSVGFGQRWVRTNDTGVDEANHSRNGMFALAAPGLAAGAPRTASILDVTPTMIDLLGLDPDPTLPGESLLAHQPFALAADRGEVDA